MKQLFLHIGFNKTGSTSLQRNLAQNSAALLEQGFLYPHEAEAAYTQRWQHAPLAAPVPGRNLGWLVRKKERRWNKLIRPFGKKSTTVISIP